MKASTPQEAMQRARQTFEDAMLALELDEHAKLALRAAASSLMKAHTVEALATFAQARRGDAESLSPN